MAHNKKLKVLYVQPNRVRGGVETTLLTLLRTFDRDRVEPYVVCLEQGEGDLVRDLRRTGSQVVVYPTTHLRDLGNTMLTIVRIATYIRRNNIDVVHTNGPKSQIYGSLAANLAQVPNVYWVHHVPSVRVGQDLMADVAFLLPTTVRLTNATLANEMATQHPFVKTPPQVLWSGIDLDRFAEAPPNNRGPQDNEHVVLIGRVQPWKGQHVLIEAARLLKEQGRNIRVSIVGSPTFAADQSYSELLHAQVREWHLEDTISFVPHTTDIVGWYHTSDVIVHASVEPEPFGLVVAEAIACGRPVVATNMGGPVDITDGGRVGGLLVPPHDSRALADAILYLLLHQEEAARLVVEGRKRVLQLYSASAMTAELQKVYESVAS